jgi:hypothetical protein
MADDTIDIWQDKDGVESDARQAAPPVTRRDLLRLSLVGGASALVAGYATQQIGESHSAERLAEVEAQLRAQAAIELAETREALQQRVRRLEQELALYRALERTGLDGLIVALLDTWDSIWRGVGDIVASLRASVESVDRTLQQWDERLTKLRAAMRFWGGLLGGVEEQVERLHQILSDIIRRTAPIGETVQSFFDSLLERIPFGWGAGLRQGADSVTGVMTSLPLLLQHSRQEVLDPLTDEWIAEEGGLNAGLFDPLRTALLAPLSSHLAHLKALAHDWEEAAAPLRRTLVERQDVQQRIATLQAAEPLTLSDERDTAL